MGRWASLVFYHTGIDIADIPVDKAARYIAMVRRAMLELKIMEVKNVSPNGITGTP